ncbi:recombinase RecA [Candidatus Wolfebacteria bacterium RIFCSPHIGHO2_01_FULL_48_22]|uniref:Protein RecA n=2 Tax=Candidatus Wolfeibacteriota TaxID=1752735 RepID=A0A1F8DQR7_9BACT|nr:MAG: recombinase RecA [Candidatus Wolfebacteria bacterium RIFCSPHIGHO2_01_FULL_48_22]OGM93485.1 MAG: recombinase RecA [Candidatus Wolfebacteria bacterium RIFCSPLOWO2_01_FULL_47_17b]
MAKNKETKSEPKDDKVSKEFENLISSLQDKFGEGSIMTLGEQKTMQVETIPTGSFTLDRALGVGGLPKGRIVEIFGPESSGKTTLALSAIAQAQKQGGRCAFIDAEHALDPEYAKRIGVKVKELLISQPDSGEEALQILENLVRSGLLSVVVVDSVAALTPRAEIEGEIGDQQIGLQARLMSQALRKLTAVASKSHTIIVFINQIRSQIGTVMWGNPETTPGGRALKFYASVRLDIRRIAQIKKGEEVIGNRTRVKVVKNKVAPPFKMTEFDILYGQGISYENDIITAALKYGVITKTGNTFTFEGEKLGVGQDAARVRLVEDKKLLREVEKKVETAASAA